MKKLFHSHSFQAVAVAAVMFGAFGMAGALEARDVAQAPQKPVEAIEAALPACDASETLDTIRGALSDASDVNVFGIHSPQELSLTRAGDLRRCVAYVTTDMRDRLTTYMVGWEDREAGIPFFAGEAIR